SQGPTRQVSRPPPSQPSARNAPLSAGRPKLAISLMPASTRAGLAARLTRDMEPFPRYVRLAGPGFPCAASLANP
ncbi:hypothetical protein JI667_22065, partial [Bacillus sp. NTK074B]|uniref:hypothetical protein n=1 Tax=Bacillus sp. NTK074B TaxID=2802174 RepID=UPI001A8E6B5E|nr:hypothetical protein [Bacillus sp. NTK074B]